MKWTCLEHDVDKACVDDVLALARVHMAKDEDMDIEDAIDEVLKKYPPCISESMWISGERAN